MIAKSRGNAEKFQLRIQEVAKDFVQERDKSHQTTTEMRRQYDEMRENLTKFIKDSEAQVADMRVQIGQSNGIALDLLSLTMFSISTIVFFRLLTFHILIKHAP